MFTDGGSLQQILLDDDSDSCQIRGITIITVENTHTSFIRETVSVQFGDLVVTYTRRFSF